MNILRISLLLFLLFIPACQSNKLQNNEPRNLFLLFEELIDTSYSNHVILSKEEVLFLVSSNAKELKILVWEKGDINELLALLDKIPIGYVAEEQYDALFFDSKNQLGIKFQQLPSYIDEKLIRDYKENLNWTFDSGLPPPKEPINDNPYIYVYKIIDKDNYKLIKEGHGLDFL